MRFLHKISLPVFLFIIVVISLLAACTTAVETPEEKRQKEEAKYKYNFTFKVVYFDGDRQTFHWNYTDRNSKPALVDGCLYSTSSKSQAIACNVRSWTYNITSRNPIVKSKVKPKSTNEKSTKSE